MVVWSRGTVINSASVPFESNLFEKPSERYNSTSLSLLYFCMMSLMGVVV